MEPQLTDILGDNLAVGLQVAYETMSYKQAHLRVGVITSIEGQYVKVKPITAGRTVTKRANQVVLTANQEGDTNV